MIHLNKAQNIWIFILESNSDGFLHNIYSYIYNWSLKSFKIPLHTDIYFIVDISRPNAISEIKIYEFEYFILNRAIFIEESNFCIILGLIFNEFLFITLYNINIFDIKCYSKKFKGYLLNLLNIIKFLLKDFKRLI